MKWPLRGLASGLLLLGLLGRNADAATAEQWRSRSIYQVLTDRFARSDESTDAKCNTEDRTYCGGSYQGIVKKLDYIQEMGFTAIWISPITLNILDDPDVGTSYHGYWQRDIYEVNPNFGSADDLKALSDELHARDMYLMVDIVVNHYGWDGDAAKVDYDQFVPFDNQSFFHSPCDINYDDQSSVEECWLVTAGISLPDLRTEDPAVYSVFNPWISALVANYSIDGLRVDTAKHVDTAFWADFNAASGVFATGEVFHGDPAYTCPYQEYMDSVLNYPIYYPLIAAFNSTTGSLSNLAAMIDTVKSTCKDSTLLATFSENHDVPRFPSLTQDMSLAQNLIAFTLLADGIPIIYQGQEQHYAGGNDPYNREALWLSGYNTEAPLYRLVASLNQIRAHALVQDSSYLTYQNWAIQTSDTEIAMRKGPDDGQIVTVLTNRGADGDSYTLALGNHGWLAGTAVVEVLTCAEVTVGADAKLQVPIQSGLPCVYYPKARLAGSGICGQ